jgi:hypothetical protein
MTAAPNVRNAVVNKLGKRITATGFALAILCLLPMGLYSLFGPEDGNPIGLGLLMVVGFPLFSLVSVIGMAIWAVAELRQAAVARRR